MKKYLLMLSGLLFCLIITGIYLKEGIEIYPIETSFIDIDTINQIDLDNIKTIRSRSRHRVISQKNVAYDKSTNTYYVNDIESMSFNYRRGYAIHKFLDKNKGEYSIILHNKNNYSEYRYISTNLPILNLTTVKNKGKINIKKEHIVRVDPMSYNEQPIFFANIRNRGATSRVYEKKSYTLDVLNPSAVDVLGAGRNHKFVLNSMYEDESKLRDLISWEIWKNILNSSEENNLPSADMQYVELFLNESYLGLYCLQQYINGDAVHEENIDIYKVIAWDMPEGSPINGKIWNGVELDCTNKTIDSQWLNLERLIDVLNMPDGEEFNNEIAEIININSVVDYYLFTEFIKARDNLWKNMFLLYKDNTLYISPWDLDITLGSRWTGKAPYLVETQNYGIQSLTYSEENNQIIDKILRNDTLSFKKTAARRYFELRTDAFSTENLIDLIKNCEMKLIASGALAREKERWPNGAYSDNNEFIKNYIKVRTDFLDGYFKGIIENE